MDPPTAATAASAPPSYRCHGGAGAAGRKCPPGRAAGPGGGDRLRARPGSCGPAAVIVVPHPRYPRVRDHDHENLSIWKDQSRILPIYQPGRKQPVYSSASSINRGTRPRAPPGAAAAGAGPAAPAPPAAGPPGHHRHAHPQPTITRGIPASAAARVTPGRGTSTPAHGRCRRAAPARRRRVAGPRGPTRAGVRGAAKRCYRPATWWQRGCYAWWAILGSNQ